MVFPWSLSESKFFQVFRTLLSILKYLSIAVVCMVPIRRMISNSFNFPFKASGDRYKRANYKLYHRHVHDREFSLFSGKV